jgi:hypothetical protein
MKGVSPDKGVVSFSVGYWTDDRTALDHLSARRICMHLRAIDLSFQCRITRGCLIELLQLIRQLQILARHTRSHRLCRSIRRFWKLERWKRCMCMSRDS